MYLIILKCIGNLYISLLHWPSDIEVNLFWIEKHYHATYTHKVFVWFKFTLRIGCLHIITLYASLPVVSVGCLNVSQFLLYICSFFSAWKLAVFSLTLSMLDVNYSTRESTHAVMSLLLFSFNVSFWFTTAHWSYLRRLGPNWTVIRVIGSIVKWLN